MKLSKFKELLQSTDNLSFVMENGEAIPPHFHLTEVGVVTKNFIDCGGTIRQDKHINFQLWYAEEDHRLTSGKLLSIINIAESNLAIEDHDVEVEYQQSTIGLYNLEQKDGQLILRAKQTACLAPDACKPKQPTIDLGANVATNTCTPGSGCC